MPPAESVGAPALQPGAAGIASRALRHVRTPLHRDGYALVVNSAFTALTGLVYWIVAANEYSAHSVGVNAALISSMMFLAGLASLNLPNVLVRFLPQVGSRTASTVAWSYLATAVMAAVAAIVFLAGIEAWAPRLQLLHHAPMMQVWFVVATMGWCVFTIQDGALTALGRAVWVPAENAVFAVAKLVLVAVIASAAPVFGVFVSWTAAMLAVVVGVNVVLFSRLVRRVPAGAPEPTAELGWGSGFGRYFLADYTGAMAWLASINLLPVVVTAVAGPTNNAYFALAWAVAFPLYAVAANIGTSLTLHGSSGGGDLPDLIRRAVRQALWMVVPAVLILVVGAPYALSLFGAEYAEHGTTLLRLIALGALPNIVLALAVAVARVERRLRGAVIALLAQAALSLGLTTPLIHAMGVVGAGVAWLGSQCLVATALLIVFQARRGTPVRSRTLAASARAAVADALSGGFGRRAQAGALARRIAAETSSPGTLRPVRTDSDVVVFLTDADPGVAVKIGCSPVGADALSAQRDALLELRRTPGLNGFAGLVPEVVHHGTLDGSRYLVERALAGSDGRTLVRTGATADALAATAARMGELYEATARDVTVDATVLSRLLDDHIGRIRAAHKSDVDDRLAALRAELSAALLGRQALIARTHGDLWLGNVLLDPRSVSLTGIVDWEASRGDDLPAVDLAHLVISTRCVTEGRDIARVVERLIDGHDELRPDEHALVEPYLRDPVDVRDLVLLAWLQHVSQRVAQSTLHHRGRWMRRNVDPVLGRFAA
jgi:O-antigen/teichoic acid export membrane protein/aminoglycoside phosphotransferase